MSEETTNRTSEAIRRVLTPLGIRTCFKHPLTTLRNVLTHVKDPVSHEEKNGVVCWVSCGDYPATYVGQTGRTLIYHLKEHKRAPTTADAINSGHEIDQPDARVIDANPLLHQCCNLGSWHIRRQPLPLIRERGILPPVSDQMNLHTSQPPTG